MVAFPNENKLYLVKFTIDSRMLLIASEQCSFIHRSVPSARDARWFSVSSAKRTVESKCSFQELCENFLSNNWISNWRTIEDRKFDFFFASVRPCSFVWQFVLSFAKRFRQWLFVQGTASHPWTIQHPVAPCGTSRPPAVLQQGN